MSMILEHHGFISAPHLPCDDITDDCLSDRVGDSVGCLHRIVRHLASGGMGHVFLAEHVHLGVYAAVKVPRLGNEAARAGIAHEARLLSQLNHPNVVSVLDVGQLADGLPYLLMEYVSGLELDAWLDSSGTMGLKRSVRVLKQVASALDYLHAQGIVHGDVKPSNILIDPRAHDFVTLVDFGIAHREDPRVERRGVVGTPAYMAPEQARGDVCGPSIDVYGLAALALELLTGKPPYDYSTAQAALTAILTQPPALPSQRGLKVAGLDAVFAKGLHADPAQRYAIASDFVDALEAVAEAQEHEQKAATKPLETAAAARPSALRARPRVPHGKLSVASVASLLPYRDPAGARSVFARFAWRVAACVAAGVAAVLPHP